MTPAALERLPVLGVGASLSLSARPDPLALARAEGGPSFVEYAGVVDVARVLPDVERLRAAGTPVLFHPSFINFCGSFANDDRWLGAAAEHIAAVGSPWFAQDCAYCFWDGGSGYASQFGWFLPPILNAVSLERAVERVREVRSRVPVPVAVEPPPVTFTVGTMPVFEFFGELAERADCALLLDMGHLVSFELATGRPVTEALAALPAGRVIEMHVAGGRLEHPAGGAPVYIDAHEAPVLDLTWAMLERLLPLLPSVRAVCFECEGVEEAEVLRTLARLRREVRDHSASAALVAHLTAAARTDAAVSRAPEGTRP